MVFKEQAISIFGEANATLTMSGNSIISNDTAESSDDGVRNFGMSEMNISGAAKVTDNKLTSGNVIGCGIM